MASRASGWHIQASIYQRDGGRRGKVGQVHERILWTVLQEIMYRCTSYLVQWPTLQGHGLETQKKEGLLCWTLWALWPYGLCVFVKLMVLE